MNDGLSIARSDVLDLAAVLGIDDDPDTIDRIHAEVAGGLDGYERLTTSGAARALTTERDVDVAFDPGPDTDPLNAFISQVDIPGADGPLSGLEIGIKDNIAVAGVPMTAGSAVFADAVPEGDATVVERLLRAGAEIVGKTNMDELAYGPTGETSTFGIAENPAAPDRVPGGSSSGSGAAVAGGVVDAALGTDTGGSVRMPASFCGLVGFKPTWGAISRHGVLDLAYTLDHVGTLTPDVRTTARLLDVLVGSDPRDHSTRGIDIASDSFVASVDFPPDMADLTLGVPAEFYGEHVADDVERVVRDQIDAIAAEGATVRDVSVPLVEDAVSVWNAIVNVEFATVLEATETPLFRRGPVDAAWASDAAGGIAAPDRSFGDVVQQKAIEGKHLVRAFGGRHYVAARNVCHELAGEFAAVLADCDALVTPTMTTRAIKRGSWSPHTYSSTGANAAPPLAVNTRPADLAGIPAVTVPAQADGLPVGVQFIAAEGDDDHVLGVAAAFELFRD
jgi:amidase/aspartyl-tRNA(Asn)/glutamyl-tRNA(Gln) amidotransferase subunit A